MGISIYHDAACFRIEQVTVAVRSGISYALTVVLLFYTCFLLQYATSFFCRGIGTQKKLIPSAVLNFGLFLFVLFFNRRYNALYALISGKLFWIFWLVAAMLPLFFLLPKNQKEDKRA